MSELFLLTMKLTVFSLILIFLVIMILQLKHGKYYEMKIIVMNHTTVNNPIEIRFLKK